MLGPELINLTVRPTPIFLEGTASLRIDEPGPRELGLTNFQVVKGLVAAERGQLFINLAGLNHAILAPDLFKRHLGQQIFFRVHVTPDGATILRPLPAPIPAIQTANATAPSPAASSPGVHLSGTPATVLQQLMSPESLRAMPAPLAAALAGWGVMLSPAMSTEAQIARVRELLGRSGILLTPPAEGVGREPGLPSILMRLLGLGTDTVTKERARGLLAELDGRQERTASALRSDVVSADMLAWVNGAPIELNLQRGRQHNPPGQTPWVFNIYTQFAKDSDVWLRVEHVPAKRVRLDAWLTDPAVYLRAQDSRAELFTKVSEFGLQLEHFAVFNQARDTLKPQQVASSAHRVGERLDSLV